MLRLISQSNIVTSTTGNDSSAPAITSCKNHTNNDNTPADLFGIIKKPYLSYIHIHLVQIFSMNFQYF